MLQVIEQTHNNMSGYHLFDFGSTWELHGSFGVFSGSLNQVKTYAISELGFSSSELNIAIDQMRLHLHNAASFGVFKRFLFTFEKEFSAEKSVIVH